MNAHWRRPALTTTVALVAWAGVLLQLVLSLQLTLARGGTAAEALVIYLGYFTVLTNIVVAGTLSLARWGGGGALARWCRRTDVAMGVLASILLVGLAYHLLLRALWAPQGWQALADHLLHSVTPLLCLLHAALCVPTRRLAWHAPWSWVLWPLAFLVYALLRGHWLGVYPYPFIDVNALGYPRTLLNAVGLLGAFWVIAAPIVAWQRHRASREPRPS